MKKIAIIAALTAMLVGAGCANDTSPTPSSAVPRLKIAATIFPLADIAQNVAGDETEVLTVIPPGASPHTFEPTPELVKKLHGVKLLFMIGHGLDAWAANLAQEIPGLETVVVDTGIELRKPGSAIAIGEHDEEGETDPHYWLDAENGLKIANTISAKLIQADPENAEAYRSKLAAYSTEIQSVDSAITKILEPHKGAKIVTHHDAWQYFAAAYGLEVIGTFEPSPGKNLTPKEMAELEKLILSNGIKTVFIEPQLSEQVAKPIADDLNLKIKTLDPQGLSLQGKGYLEMLEANARTVSDSL